MSRGLVSERVDHRERHLGRISTDRQQGNAVPLACGDRATQRLAREVRNDVADRSALGLRLPFGRCENVIID
jgi:hypothetical protein